MNTFAYIYKFFFKKLPSACIVLFASLLVSAMVPSALTISSAHLFDSVFAIVSQQQDASAKMPTVFFFMFLYLGVYLFDNILGSRADLIKNADIFNKGSMYFKSQLNQKTLEIPIINYENADFLNELEAAKKAVEGEKMSSLFYSQAEALGALIALLGICITVGSINWMLLPISALSLAPYFITRMLRGRDYDKLKRIQLPEHRKKTYLWKLFTGSSSVKEMRVSGFSDFIFNKWENTRKEIRDKAWAIEMKDAKILVLCSLIQAIGFAGAFGILQYLTYHRNITIGEFGAMCIAFKALQDSMKNFLYQTGRLKITMSEASDFIRFMNRKFNMDVDIGANATPNSIFHSTYKERDGDSVMPWARLTDVCFDYPGSSGHAIDHVNMEIKRGAKTAIVGLNGSGKSTLVKLLLGLYEPSVGVIERYGNDASDEKKERLGNDPSIKNETGVDESLQNISVVAQDFVKYEMTIRENIAISDTEHLYDEKRISENIERVGLSGIDDYDAVLGRRFGGMELSGGEWQKLAISRGTYKECDFIALDEPSSNLDPVVETQILQKILEVAHNRTVVIVSHRLGLCKFCDQIIVMEDGKVAEMGTHKELMDVGDKYARLYAMQAKWYE